MSSKRTLFEPPAWVCAWRQAWREGLDAGTPDVDEDFRLVRISNDSRTRASMGAVWWLDAIESISSEPRTGHRVGLSGTVWSQIGNKGAIEILVTMNGGMAVSVSAARLDTSSIELIRNFGVAVSRASFEGTQMLMETDATTLQQWAVGNNEVLRRVAATSPDCPDIGKALAYLAEGSSTRARVLDPPDKGWRPSTESLTHALLTCILLQAEIQRSTPNEPDGFDAL